MLIQWRASSQWVVSMCSPSSGVEASSVIGGVKLVGRARWAPRFAWADNGREVVGFRRRDSRRGNVASDMAAVSNNSVYGCVTNFAELFRRP